MKLCEVMGFEFSVMIDAGIFRYRPIATQQQVLIDETKYALETFATSHSYSMFNGVPLVWEFDIQEYGIDLTKIIPKLGQSVFMMSQFTLHPGCQGTFAWINSFSPGTPGSYLSQYQSHPPSKLDVPVLFAGFNDSDPKNPNNSVWGGPARIIPWGLETWAACMKSIKSSNRYFPILQIATWNDYEEGSQLETTIKSLTGASY
jgi:hypothetical protein